MPPTGASEEHGYICPNCGGKLSKDRKCKGYVRHIFYGALNRLGANNVNGHCRWGRGMRDRSPLTS